MLVVAIDLLAPELIGVLWFMPAAYFVLNIAHSGTRVGRKTYVVDLASGNRRTSYVAVGNSVIGVALLLTGLLGTLVSVIGTSGMIFLLSLMGAAGALLCVRLPET
jgi:small-conductance mechanosensitive channel